MAELELAFYEQRKNRTIARSSSLGILSKGKEKMVWLKDSICEKVTPKAGMIFNSEEEVYNEYSIEGFGITKRNTRS